MPPGTAMPIDIFYSYAREDDPFRQEMEKHLKLLQRQGLIKAWHDCLIPSGADWAREINTHLERASLILLLISADFLASDYCYSVELKRALQRHEANEARVLPIVVRSCNWSDAPFAHLQMLPKDALPISKWADKDEAWTDVVTSIRRVIEDLPFLSAGIPSAPLPSVWNIPYPRNPYFTGREDILLRLRTLLQAGQATALSQTQAISGLGGIGKTQIAVEYAYQHRQDYQLVLWSFADTREALVAGYVAIADLLNLPQKKEKDQTIIVNAVRQWLTNNSGWLLILDNADDLAMVYEFLPLMPNGHVLLTTRAQATGRRASRIVVDTMPSDAGTLLLLRRAKLIEAGADLEQAIAADIAIAKGICEELGGLPLALDQAGAYIEEAECSLNDYSTLYRQSQSHFLKRRGALVADYPQSVATTWSLSFERVELANPAAADLLRVCAFLAPDAIPEEIITEGAMSLGPLLAPLATDPSLLNEIIVTLRAYSLVRRDTTNKTLTVHRLVQAVLRDVLDEGTRRNWKECVVRAVNATFPEVEFRTWQQCERCLPHAQNCADLIEQGQLILPEAVSLLRRAGAYLIERIRYREADLLLQQALLIGEQHFGSQHPETASILDRLARLFEVQGKYEQAEPLFTRALAIRERQLGLDHPDTASSLNNLALLYKIQGKYREAEPLYERALAIREHQLELDHPDTAITLNNLASLYRGQGKYKEAETLYVRVLAIYEQQLGFDHPRTAIILNNLARLYELQGKDEEAEPLYERALAICERQLGPDHPDTATRLNNLATFYRRRSKYKESEPLLLRALAIYEQRLGPDHPSTAITLDNLGHLYKLQGRYEEAEPVYVRALTICEQLGSDHPDTAARLDSLGLFYFSQSKYEQAEPLLRRALMIEGKRLGSGHFVTGTHFRNLGLLYLAQNKYELAEPLLIQALAINEKLLGSEHPIVVRDLNNLVAFYRVQGKYEQAERLAERVSSIKENLGPHYSQAGFEGENTVEIIQEEKQD